MLMQNRSLVVAALALSLGTMTGCAALPGGLLAGKPGASATAQTASSLKVLVDSSAYKTQGVDLSAIAIHARLEFPYQPDAVAKSLDLQSGVPAVFGDLAPGHARLTVSAQNVETNEVVDTQSQWIDLLPGIQATARFALTIGGSTAADVGLTFGANTKDYRTFDQNDGYDPDFRAAAGNNQSGDRRVMPFQLVTPEGTTFVTFTQEWDHLHRQIGNLPSVSYPRNSWYLLPAHAERIDSEPLMGYTKVRHFRWSNEHVVGGEPHFYTFDRWVTPFDGTIKETVTENGTVISTLSRSPIQLAGMVTRNGAPSDMPLPLGLKRWDGSGYVPVDGGMTGDGRGSYMFFGLTPGQYQVVYDATKGYQDSTLAALVVSAPVQVGEIAQAPFGLDAAWDLQASVGGPNGIHDFKPGDAFGFAPKASAPDAEYQVMVASASYSPAGGPPVYQPVWSSGWGPAGSVAWNGKMGPEVNDPAGPDAENGEYAYLVRFRKQGTVYGGEGYYGQSHWLPFHLTRQQL